MATNERKMRIFFWISCNSCPLASFALNLRYSMANLSSDHEKAADIYMFMVSGENDDILKEIDGLRVMHFASIVEVKQLPVICVLINDFNFVDCASANSHKWTR